MRCGFLLMTGFLLGFLAETEKELRAEIAFTNHFLSLARVGGRFASVLQEVMSEIGRIFGSRQVYEVVAQSSTGRVFKWDVALSQTPHARMQEIPSTQAASVLMQGYPHTFYMQRKGEKRNAVSPLLTKKDGDWICRNLKHLEMPVRGGRVGSRDQQRDGR